MTSSSGAAEAPPVCYRHPRYETYVSCTRCERPICPDCMRPAAVGFQCPSCVKEGNASMRPVKAAYGGKARTKPEVTYALLGLNVLFFLLTASGSALVTFSGEGYSSLFQKLALAPSIHLEGTADGAAPADGVAQGEYHRLLTSMFLHANLVHLLLNMYALMLVGPVLEWALGRLRFTALYLLSGLGGSALSYAWSLEYGSSVGASGAIFGLSAGYCLLEWKRGYDVTQIAGALAINFVLGFMIPIIDWRGHLGGLIAGALVTFALVHAPPGRQRTLLQALGCVAVAVTVTAVIAARTLQLTA